MDTGFLQVNGSGPRNASVGVFDVEGNLIAETSSDSNGFWSISSVEMPVGQHEIRAEMRSDSGRMHISNPIKVDVSDPDADVDIAAEQWSREDIVIAEEMEAGRQEKEMVRAAFDKYDELLEGCVKGSSVSDGELSPVLNLTGASRDQFYASVAQARAKRSYARLVCTAAAGLELEENDKRDIWRNYKKSGEQFAADVSRTQRFAGVAWQASLIEEALDI